MKLEHSFQVPAPPDRALALLLDPEQVLPCLPGAQLTEVVDPRYWKATMAVKLGPVGMDFATEVKFVQVDEAAGKVRMQASGRDVRGKGGAQADIDAAVAAVDGGTLVNMATDVRFSGQAVQLGRPSVVQDVSTKLVSQFAECLRAQMSTDVEVAHDAAERSEKPLSGFSLMLAAIRGWFRRLFGRNEGQGKGGSA
jgi:carbon monoxide dehydrogenase subunit G